jgi:hypothetical protein
MSARRMSPRPEWFTQRRMSPHREWLTQRRVWPPRGVPSRISAAACRMAAAPPSTSAAAVALRMAAAARHMAAVAPRRMAEAAALQKALVGAAAKASIDAKPGLNLSLTLPEQSRATHALIGQSAPQRRRNRTVVA